MCGILGFKKLTRRAWKKKKIIKNTVSKLRSWEGEGTRKGRVFERVSRVSKVNISYQFLDELPETILMLITPFAYSV